MHHFSHIALFFLDRATRRRENARQCAPQYRTDWNTLATRDAVKGVDLERMSRAG